MRELGLTQRSIFQLDIGRRDSQPGSEDLAQLTTASNKAAAIPLRLQPFSASAFRFAEEGAYPTHDLLLHIEHACENLQAITLENRRHDPGPQPNSFIKEARKGRCWLHKCLTDVAFGGRQQSRPRAGEGNVKILAQSQRPTSPARAGKSGKVELRPVKRHTWIPIAGALVRTGAFLLERRLPFTRISSIEQSRKREDKEP
ncbi:hypothetical protein BraRD5C2_54310 [Bradyrhizobium sp. RD5-C2]|nr:hypothetical protein BraRD5C2_54310 [Bradyrhizobium sp. RD5-C2]